MRPDSTQTTVALYKRVESEIRQQIENAQLSVGSMLPSRRDLAKQFGVSTLTVERAIDGLVRSGLLRSDDRRGTFIASQAAVHDLINPARSTTPTVGIVSTLYLLRNDHLALNNHWVQMLVQAVEHGFSEEGESTVFHNRVQPDGSVESLRETVGCALAGGHDGLIIIAFGQSPEEVDDCLSDVIDRGTPVVCVTSGELRRPVPHVFLGSPDAGYQAAQHLLRQGCERLLFLSPFEASWTLDRLGGARTAMEHAGLDAGAIQVFPENRGPWINEADPEVLGYEAGIEAFQSQRVPLGVICANDGVALGFLRAAEQCERTLGKDLLVVGFDDHPDSRARQLTSLRPPMSTLGQEAARLLRLSLAHKQDSLQVRLRWRLIPRASSRLTS